ncbi:MAG: hypothetical protein H6868_09400 [Rhodospirillales bacterium]|nr:hypothetical protein [Rhodospirillales bacterium]
MKCALTPQKPNESGNAVWFVLIAIVLMATLTIAITRSSDNTEQSGRTEQYRIQASQIMRTAKNYEQAVDRLRMNGCSENEISFESPDWILTSYTNPGTSDGCKIFDPAGAGLSVPNERDSSQTPIWTFKGSLEIQGIETTNNNAFSTDLLTMYIFPDSEMGLCMEINKILGLGSTVPVDDTGTVIAAPNFTGGFAYTGTLGTGTAAPEIAGKKSGCFQLDIVPLLVFYHVLIAR